MSGDRVRDPGVEESRPPRLGPGFLAIVAGVYVAALAIATWPTCRVMGTALPSLADPIQHIWVMRWYQDCMRAGRLPFDCPDVQYPVGAAFGYFSPLHAQSLVFGLLSLGIENDILKYNLVWFLGFLGTGLGTFTLVWQVVRDRAAALLGGLMGMLSGAVMIHAIGHIDILYLGAVPLFYLAWMRFVDAPGSRRLAAAVGSYLLVALSHAYYVHLAMVPAAAYVAWSFTRGGRREFREWIRGRVGWFAAFAAAVIPLLALLYSSQILALGRGDSDQALASRRHEFEIYGAPLWSYVTPTHFHAIGRLLPFNVHIAAGHDAGMIERSSYLGLVCLFLLHRCAFRGGDRGRAAKVWWVLLGVLVVLGMGASTRIGTASLPLPCRWLWDLLPNFRMLRAPGRFNLFAIPCVAVLAGIGLRSLLEGRREAVRWGVTAGLAVLVVADLAMVPFGMRYEPPRMPAFYRQALAKDPHATFLEAPVSTSGNAEPLTALAGYWQSRHHGRTTAAYSGCPNFAFDNRVARGSPFESGRLADPGYPREVEQFDLVRDVRFDDYAWLYLRANDLRYVMLHRSVGPVPTAAAGAERVIDRLEPAQVANEGELVVFDRDRLALPCGPVVYCLEGWKRPAFASGPAGCQVERTAILAAYCPPGTSELRLRIAARGLRGPCRLRLEAGKTRLAEWTVRAGAAEPQTLAIVSPPVGYREWSLTVEPLDGSRGGSKPARIFVDHLAVEAGAGPSLAVGPTVGQSKRE